MTSLDIKKQEIEQAKETAVRWLKIFGKAKGN